MHYQRWLSHRDPSYVAPRSGGRKPAVFVGDRFGRRVVVAQVESSGGKRRYLCVCDCGEKTVAGSNDLRSASKRSCGCLAREIAARLLTTHGYSRSPTYASWDAMRDRCTKPNATGYERYGGRGITVCDRWLTSFEAFLEDMGPRPEGTSLGRFGDVGNYEPGNCAWQTPAEQAAEQRKKKARANSSDAVAEGLASCIHFPGCPVWPDPSGMIGALPSESRAGMGVPGSSSPGSGTR